MSLETKPNKQPCTHCGVLIALLLLQFVTGCSQRFWRQQAENDSYEAISEKLNNPHWELPRITTNPDARSRFYDPYDPDCEPLPPDDPAAHKFMHCADGKQGYKHWHELGDTMTVENPRWLEPYTVLMQGGNPVNSHNQVSIPKLNLKDSLELTYIHSREFQSAIEDVYLQALALTEQRYLLNTRFNLNGPGAGGANFNSTRAASGNTTHTLRNGIGIQQLLPSGGQFGVDLLNTITWSPRDAVSATGLAWGLTQPLLEAAGRKVRMETLVQAERNLLYEVRDMARFRQTTFTAVAADYLRIQQQYQNLKNAQNNIRQLQEGIEIGKVEDSYQPIEVKEPLERLPEGAEIPESLAGKLRYDGDTLIWSGDITDEQKTELIAISEDRAFQSAAQQLIRWRENEVVSLNVLQLTTQLNAAQNDVEGSIRQLADLKDNFKIRLGLPPDVAIEIDTQFLSPFELIDRDLLAMADELKEFAKAKGPALIPAPRGQTEAINIAPEFDDLQDYIADLDELTARIRNKGLQLVKDDFQPVRSILDATSDDNDADTSGRTFDSKTERDRVIRDVAGDMRLYRLNEQKFNELAEGLKLIQALASQGSADALKASLDADADGQIQRSELPKGFRRLPGYKEVRRNLQDEEDNVAATITADELTRQVRDTAVQIRQDLLQIVQGLQVVQAGLRVEVIPLNPFEVEGIEDTPTIAEVVQYGLENRHDLMNAKAEVMDARRQMEVTANALKSVLDLNVSGDVDLDGGNATDSVRVSVDFKAPLDHVRQRNDYNASQIAYQRARRAYMATEDNIKRDIRVSWRQMRVARQRLEIDRQTVRNAARQYDNVATDLVQVNSLSLLNALSSVLRAQNSLIGDWISYETSRLNIFRDMGIMDISQDGIWQDRFYLQDGPGVTDAPIIPEVLNLEDTAEMAPPAPQVP